MKTKKRFLGILLSLVLVLGILPGMRTLPAVADELYDGQILLPELKTAAYSAEKADGGSDDVFVRNMALQKKSTAQSNSHGIVLEDRKNMTLTGIKVVSSLNEQKIVLLTEMDQLTITGRSLRLINFSPKTGDLRVDGTIDSLVYGDKNNNRGSLREGLKELRVRQTLQKESIAQSNNHGIVLKDRKNMTLTGIKVVSNLNEQKIVLLTEMDQLTITGRSLHVINFSPKTGDLRVDGTIDSLVYGDKNNNRGSLWEKIKRINSTPESLESDGLTPEPKLNARNAGQHLKKTALPLCRDALIK